MKFKKQTVTIDGFVHAEKDFIDDIKLSFFQSDMSQYGYVKVQPVSINLNVDEFDYNLLKIKSLETVKKKIMAENKNKLNKIDEEIQKLLCITDAS